LHLGLLSFGAMAQPEPMQYAAASPA